MICNPPPALIGSLVALLPNRAEFLHYSFVLGLSLLFFFSSFSTFWSSSSVVARGKVGNRGLLVL